MYAHIPYHTKIKSKHKFKIQNILSCLKFPSLWYFLNCFSKIMFSIVEYFLKFVWFVTAGCKDRN